MKKWINPNRSLKQILCRHDWRNMDDVETDNTYMTHKDGRKIIRNFMAKSRGCEKCGLVQQSVKRYFQDDEPRPIFNASILTVSNISYALETVIIYGDSGEPRIFQTCPTPPYPEPTNVKLVEITHREGEPKHGLLKIEFQNSGDEFIQWLIGKKIETRVYHGAYTPGKDYKVARVLKIGNLESWNMTVEPSPHNPSDVVNTTVKFFYTDMTTEGQRDNGK
jgi:hypothetical protein